MLQCVIGHPLGCFQTTFSQVKIHIISVLGEAVRMHHHTFITRLKGSWALAACDVPQKRFSLYTGKTTGLRLTLHARADKNETGPSVFNKHDKHL